MPHTPSSPTFSLFPTAPAAPHAFTLFSMSHSPRESYAVYDEFANILKPSGRDNRRASSNSCELKDVKRSKSSPSLKKAWRKLLGLETSEPHFEIVTSESQLSLSQGVKIVESPVDSIHDADIAISGVPLSRPHSALSSDDDGLSSDGTLVDDVPPSIIVTVERI